MRKSRFSEAQIIEILRQADAGMKVMDLCRQHEISDATLYKWRSKYGGLGVSEAVRLRQLVGENRHLKRLVADQAGHPGAQRGAWEKLTEPAERRQAVRHVIAAHGYSERRACSLIELNRRTYRRSLAPDPNADLRVRLRELAEERRRFGRLRLTSCCAGKAGW